MLDKKPYIEIVIIDATTQVKCLCDNNGVIGHVVCQPCWKKRKTLDFCISKTALLKKFKLGTCEVLPMGNKCDF